MRKGKTRKPLISFIVIACFVIVCAVLGVGMPKESVHFDSSQVPDYSGEPYVIINDNVPYFTESDLDEKSYEWYGELDELGRATGAMAMIDESLFPTQERGSIGMIKPSGWQTVRYDDLIEGKYLYNRCHLIGYQLTGENANENNLITGTRYMNVTGMLGWENRVRDHIEEYDDAVLYRVTPVYEGDNLLADGVLMEAESRDGTLAFCVFCYNVQPGIGIDYSDGTSWRK